MALQPLSELLPVPGFAHIAYEELRIAVAKTRLKCLVDTSFRERVIST